MTRHRRKVLYLQRRGYVRPRLILRAIRHSKINFAEALVLLRKESGGGRNVFGCDHGPRSSAPWCGQKVTLARYVALRRSGLANGVGPTQLTFPGFLSPLSWRPYFNMRKGFSIFRGYRRRATVWGAALSYNGGEDYANDFVRQLGAVKRSLRKAGL